MTDPEIVYLDLETTGTEPTQHTITEMGFIFGRQRNSFFDKDGGLRIWVTPSDEELRAADVGALKVNGYNAIFQERESEGRRPGVMQFSGHKKRDLAAYLAKWTDGVLFAGCNVKFDQQFLDQWLRRNGACPTWDYHVIDIPTYAAGVYNAKLRHTEPGKSEKAIQPPYKTSKLSKAYGIAEPVTAHTALGDAQWGKELYEAAVAATL